ncbi:MAG: hypothetical protein U1E65_03295 [Myxococcota bacterium]
MKAGRIIGAASGRPIADRPLIKTEAEAKLDPSSADLVERRPRHPKASGTGHVRSTGTPLLRPGSPLNAKQAADAPKVTAEALWRALLALPEAAFEPASRQILDWAGVPFTKEASSLGVLDAPIPDRFLHSLLTRAMFNLANDLPATELPGLLKQSFLSSISRLASTSASITDMVRILTPAERRLCQEALISAGLGNKRDAKAWLDPAPASGLSVVASATLEELGAGLERARHTVAMQILMQEVRRAYQTPARDPFVRGVHQALVEAGHTTAIADTPAGVSQLIAAVKEAFARSYADPDGSIPSVGLRTPGAKVGSYYANTLATPLWWEAVARRQEVSPELKSAEHGLKHEIERLTTVLKQAKRMSRTEARALILDRLNQVNRSDLSKHSRLDVSVGIFDTRDGSMTGLDEILTPAIKAFNDDYDRIPKRLEMLERSKARIADDTFRDHLVLTVQHQVGVVVPFLEALVEKGARPEDIKNIGVPYSSNPQVELKLAALGMDNVVPATLAGLKPALEKALEELIERSKKTGKPILVIDDGGTVMDLISTRFPKDAHRFRIVEQTMRGITATKEAIARGGFRPPTVVAAATAGIKNVADQHIAETALRALRQIVRARDELLPVEVAPELKDTAPAIMGFGTISGSLAEHLAQEIRRPGETLIEARGRVGVWDKDPKKRRAAAALGFFVPKERDALFKGRDLLIGATGFSSISKKDLEKLPPYCLAMSMSSKKIEFEPDLEQKVFESGFVAPKDSALRGFNILGTYTSRAAFGLGEQLDRPNEHQLVEVLRSPDLQGNPAGPIMVNRLQPINFDHSLFCVPEDRAQLIRAIMLEAAAQAVTSAADLHGVVELDPKRQASLLGDWQQIEAAQARPAPSPR